MLQTCLSSFGPKLQLFEGVSAKADGSTLILPGGRRQIALCWAPCHCHDIPDVYRQATDTRKSESTVLVHLLLAMSDGGSAVGKSKASFGGSTAALHLQILQPLAG